MDTEQEMIRPSEREQESAARPTGTPPACGAANMALKAKRVVVTVLLLLLAAGGLTLLNRARQGNALVRETELNSVPTVAVVHPLAEKSDEELVLPGSMQAFEESPIYARTNGYLMQWYKDIGSRIVKGDLLARLDTPEVDQELSQTRANRELIKAQLEFARISSDRWQNLRKSDAVSQQETDQQTSGYKQSVANLAAADANVRRLEQLESFKNIYAPFSGVLTKRNVDVGALINAGAGGREMFDIAKVDTLRVYVNVPQAYSPMIRNGMKAWVTLQEFPDRKFMGAVARTADAIDTATRTLLTEVDVPNPKGLLLPGSFGRVHFVVKSSVNKVTIPVNAMLFRAEGPCVGVVLPDGKVRLRPISIGRDYGTTLEILSGIEPDEQIIINPSDSLEDGQLVKVVEAKPEISH